MTTKEKILKKALELFVKQGIDKTSTRKITESLSLSEGALFVHFKTKQILIDSIYLEGKKSLQKTLVNIIDEKENTEKNIKNILDKMGKFYIKNYELFLYQTMVNIGNNVSKNILEEGQKEMFTIFDFLEKSVEKGIIKNLPIDLIKKIIWSNFSTILQYEKSENKKEIREEYLDIIWKSIKK